MPQIYFSKSGSCIRDQKGFSLIEILLVVMILGALAAMVVPRLSGRSDQAKVSVAKSDIEANLATALKLYELDNGNFPTTSQGLEALLEQPGSSPVPANWNGPYIEKRPIDPWGNPYVYESPGSHRLDYDLSSQGKNAKGEEDDIVNWQ
jgi:general secretion pathway protein G